MSVTPKSLLSRYHDFGDYDRDLAIVAGKAKAWLTSRAGDVTKPAVVFDIDETVLSNWDVLRRDDFGRPVSGPCTPSGDTPCGMGSVGSARPRSRNRAHLGPLPGQPPPRTWRCFSSRAAPKASVKPQRAIWKQWDTAATKCSRWCLEGAHFASAVDFKTPVRAQIEKDGYTIIVNIGDQPSDLLGGHAEKCFLLPDPFYRVP